jgi:hypothetical protein
MKGLLMNSKILNKHGEVVYECAGGIGYDHHCLSGIGHWVKVYSLDKLTTGEKEGYEFSEYYGQEYTLVEETEKSDNICSCCNRPLPEKDHKKIESKSHKIIITEMLEGRQTVLSLSLPSDKSWMVCFR